MRRLTFVAALALAVGVLLPGSAFGATGGSDLPFKGSISGTSVHNLSTGQVHATSTGEVTHLGLTTVVQDASLTPSNPTTFSWSGTWTLTAANGDQIVGTAAGTCTRPSATATEISCIVDYASSGGTGRFADASAAFRMTMHSVRVAFDPGPPVISYGEHEGSLNGELDW